MQELSLNILDIAQNSVAAGASLVEIGLVYRLEEGEPPMLTITVADNGRGMSEETARQVADPFYTTRTTRKVGLGTSLFKLAAELTGGSFGVKSRPGEGTVVTAVLYPDHLDAAPMGDIAATYTALVQTTPDIDFVLMVRRTGGGPGEFSADTRQFREILQGVPLDAPEVLGFRTGSVRENMGELLGDTPFM